MTILIAYRGYFEKSKYSFMRLSDAAKQLVKEQSETTARG